MNSILGKSIFPVGNGFSALLKKYTPFILMFKIEISFGVVKLQHWSKNHGSVRRNRSGVRSRNCR